MLIWIIALNLKLFEKCTEMYIFFPNPSERTAYDTMLFFFAEFIGFSSEFSF